MRLRMIGIVVLAAVAVRADGNLPASKHPELRALLRIGPPASALPIPPMRDPAEWPFEATVRVWDAAGVILLSIGKTMYVYPGEEKRQTAELAGARIDLRVALDESGERASMSVLLRSGGDVLLDQQVDAWLPGKITGSPPFIWDDTK
jgi:hypothetical protein